MATLTEEEIEKIARNLITAPQVIETLPEFEKLRAYANRPKNNEYCLHTTVQKCRYR